MKANLEPLLRPPNSSLVSRQVSLPSFDHPYHFHPEIEITFIAESSGTRVIGDHIGSFHAGELYLLGVNLPHVFRNTAPPGRRAKAEVLHFLYGSKSTLLKGIPEMREFSLLLDRGKSGLVFDRKTSLRGGRLLRRIRETDGVRRLAAFFDLAAVLLGASAPRMLAGEGDSAPVIHSAGSVRIHRICNIILEGFRENLSHSEMARHAHMAPSAFSRLFRRTTRKTFTQFVIEVRLGHVCRLLGETSKTVADIAFESGFDNLAHFNRQFRRHHQCSPREYRTALGTATQLDRPPHRERVNQFEH